MLEYSPVSSRSSQQAHCTVHHFYPHQVGLYNMSYLHSPVQTLLLVPIIDQSMCVAISVYSNT
jgi:hypothetical protein